MRKLFPRTALPAPLLAALFTVFLLLLSTSMPTLSAHADSGDWDQVAADVESTIEKIPSAYGDGDQEQVEHLIRQAYYETYQVSGLESQINHRLGEERNQEFVKQLLTVRQLTRDGADSQHVDEAVQAALTLLKTDMAELAQTPELNDKWTRTATRAIESLQEAKQAYDAGDFPTAANAARDAYLAHYEADGLEKASISYLGQGRVSQVETQFTLLRQEGRDGSLSAEEYASHVDSLIQDLTDDAAQLDSLTSETELGWSGFWASFTILLREGAEALLVVAALVTFAKRAGRKDQLKGIAIGVVAALVVAAGIAFLFARLTATAASGLGQELVGGITGLLAVAMLIWVSNWILSKSTGKKWENYVSEKAQKGTATGGVLALASVAFLAVLREGAETILFFSPILAATKTRGDVVLIWSGVGAATAILAILFAMVWVFGIKLPMKAFFRWTSILLGILAVTIAGGAIKEFQDATVIAATPVPGVPTITILGIYPTVQTLVAQVVVIAVLVALSIVQLRVKSKSAAAE